MAGVPQTRESENLPTSTTKVPMAHSVLSMARKLSQPNIALLAGDHVVIENVDRLSDRPYSTRMAKMLEASACSAKLF